MKAYRATHNGVERSPLRRLFGRLDDSIIGPLGFCLFVRVGNGYQYSPPTTPGVLLGAPVEHLGVTVGTVSSYDWPLAGGEVDPTVRIQPTIPSFDRFPTAVSSTPTAAAGTAIQLETFDSLFRLRKTSVGGSVVEPPRLHTYGDPAHVTSAYLVSLDKTVNPDMVGARVILQADQALLGMLIAAPRPGDPNRYALVHPAHPIAPD